MNGKQYEHNLNEAPETRVISLVHQLARKIGRLLRGFAFLLDKEASLLALITRRLGEEGGARGAFSSLPCSWCLYTLSAKSRLNISGRVLVMMLLLVVRES